MARSARSACRSRARTGPRSSPTRRATPRRTRAAPRWATSFGASSTSSSPKTRSRRGLAAFGGQAAEGGKLDKLKPIDAQSPYSLPERPEVSEVCIGRLVEPAAQGDGLRVVVLRQHAHAALQVVT